MVNKGEQSFWVPVNDKNHSIVNYQRWVFRVFLDIYTTEFKERMSQLIQYGHIIQTASASYAWENVYLYDREFRWHIECFPNRSWGAILQQAWTMFLKDRVNTTPIHGKQGGSGSGHHKSGIAKKLCFSFNCGNCRFGSKCRFDHRCGLCGKFGHRLSTVTGGWLQTTNPTRIRGVD